MKSETNYYKSIIGDLAEIMENWSAINFRLDSLSSTFSEMLGRESDNVGFQECIENDINFTKQMLQRRLLWLVQAVTCAALNADDNNLDDNTPICCHVDEHIHGCIYDDEPSGIGEILKTSFEINELAKNISDLEGLARYEAQ